MSKQREVLVLGHGESYPALGQLSAILSDQARAQAAKVATLEARCARLHKALEPFSRFYAAWIAAPLGGHDDVLYAIHTGTQFAAALRLSDMKSAHDAVLAQEGKCPSVERMEKQ